ncbi:MAG: hypothetical protein HQ494_03155 [Rhodospirillales bacterium]|nr:hypothetical protein [Rhodospirillales bacterium]
MTAPKSFTWRTEFAWVMAAAFLTAGTAAMPVIQNPLFYFQDDFQIQFMPMFGEIARLLKSGEFPLLTDRIWHGGAILAEYQFAVFNPVSLGAYLVVDEVDQLHHGATLFVLIHISILAGGLNMLARDLGADPLASLMAAVVGGTSSWLIYWGSSDWVPALVGSTWLPWALWGLLRAYRDARWVPPAALLSYMVLVGGWPYANVALIAALAVTLPILFYIEVQFTACFRIALAFGSALLLAAPAVFPLIAILGESVRAQDLLLWRTSLDGMVMALGFPFFPDLWRIWDGSYQVVVSPPIYYLSWFVPLVLVNALGQRSMYPASTKKIILWSITAVFAILCLSPALWHFRYAFRFLPYYHFALALLVAIFVTEQRQSKNETSWRVWPTGIALLVPFLIAIANGPELWRIQVEMALAIAVAALIVMWFQRRGIISWPVLLVASHVLLFVALTAITPSNKLVSNWRPPLARAEFDLQQANDARTFALYPPLAQTEFLFGGMTQLPGNYWATIAPGNTALYRRTQTVNGYTPILQRGFVENFCLGLRGTTCSEGPSKVLAVDPQTNLSYLDMTGVDRVVAIRGSYSTMFANHAGKGWAVIDRTELADIFERTTPQRRIGNIVQWPDGVQIRNPTLKTRSDSYTIGGGHSGGRVIVARAWYPGFRVRLNGKDIPVEPIAGLVPSLVLPAGAHGELVIDYWPAGLTAGIYTALAGILILSAFAVIPLFSQRRVTSS